jgi:hypothetical protein
MALRARLELIACPECHCVMRTNDDCRVCTKLRELCASEDCTRFVYLDGDGFHCYVCYNTQTGLGEYGMCYAHYAHSEIAMRLLLQEKQMMIEGREVCLQRLRPYDRPHYPADPCGDGDDALGPVTDGERDRAASRPVFPPGSS